MLFLNSEEVTQCLPMKQAVEGMRRALAALSGDQATIPLRSHIDVEQHSGTTLIMPAMVRGDADPSLTVKIVSVFQNNPIKQLARIQAIVVAFDPETGLPIAILEGSSLTGIRTAAASGAATDCLARESSKNLAILGAGVQARTHLQAMLAVRDIENVKVFSRNPESAQSFVNDVKESNIFAGELTVASSANDAVQGADIVCTVTTSKTDVFDEEAIGSGCHINAVGSYQPHVREVPPATVARARVFVDHVESAMSEAGDLIQPLESGLIDQRHILGEVGQVILGDLSGRLSNDDVTLFKSVGNAAEDAVAAQIVIQNAANSGIGQMMDL